MVAEILSLFFIFNFAANPYVSLLIMSLTIYTTYFLFHKKTFLKRFYYITPEAPRDNKKYYAIVFIFMLALFFIINFFANVLSLFYWITVFFEWLITGHEARK